MGTRYHELLVLLVTTLAYQSSTQVFNNCNFVPYMVSSEHWQVSNRME